MHRQLFSTLTLAAVLSTLGACALPQLDVAPRYSQLSLDGDFGITSGPVLASADLEAMGLDESEGVPGIRADFKWGLPHLIVSASQASFSGDGTLDATLSQGGFTITQGTQVSSDIDMGLYTGLLVWDIFPGKTFELAGGFGLGLIDFDIDINDPGSVASLSASETVPIPLLALNGGIHIGGVEVGLLLSGASLSLDSSEGTYFDADAHARFKIFGGTSHIRSSLIIGWRELSIDVEYDEGGDKIEADVGLSGPYISLEITL